MKAMSDIRISANANKKKNDELADLELAIRHGSATCSANNGRTNIKPLLNLLNCGLGVDTVPTWFAVSAVPHRIRVKLHQFSLALPELLRVDGQPLLDFFVCCLKTRTGASPLSPLRVFNKKFPDLVVCTIEEFLLPSRVARKTLKQVVAYFATSLNDLGAYGYVQNATQLYNAVYECAQDSQEDFDSVLHLLSCDGIDVNTGIIDSMQQRPFTDMYMTPLTRALDNLSLYRFLLHQFKDPRQRNERYYGEREYNKQVKEHEDCVQHCLDMSHALTQAGALRSNP